MKKLKAILAIGILLIGIGSMGSCKAGKCDCPKFSKRDIPTPQQADIPEEFAENTVLEPCI